jgi:ferritin
MRKLLLNTKSLEKLIAVEEHASRLYRYLSHKADVYGFLGASSWFRKQSNEEIEHHCKVIDFIADRGACIELPQPENIKVSKCETLLDMLNISLEAEITVEKEWKTFAASVIDSDITCYQFALEFIKEQFDEIAAVSDLIAKYQSFKDESVAIHDIDEMMSKR